MKETLTKHQSSHAAHLVFGLFHCPLFHFLVHLRLHMRLEELGKLRSGQVFCPGRFGRGLHSSPFLTLQQALGTEILAVMLLVLSAVEQTADLMNPALTVVTLHPAFLMHFVVLLLLEVVLAIKKIDEGTKMLWVEMNCHGIDGEVTT